jgi:hypothetical protein
MHYSTPVLGDEQFIDVELDRHTVFLPEIPEPELPAWDTEPSAHNLSFTKDGEEHKEEPGKSPKTNGSEVLIAMRRIYRIYNQTEVVAARVPDDAKR